jgi:ABC-type uncharacterized transport system permease subunit
MARLALTSMLTGMGFGAIAVFWRNTIHNPSLLGFVTASIVTAFITIGSVLLIRSYKKTNSNEVK